MLQLDPSTKDWLNYANTISVKLCWLVDASQPSVQDLSGNQEHRLLALCEPSKLHLVSINHTGMGVQEKSSSLPNCHLQYFSWDTIISTLDK